MKHRVLLLLMVLWLIPTGHGAAQSPRRRPVARPAAQPPAAVPSPTPTPAPKIPVAPTNFGPLATVNGQTITAADLDPAVAQEMSDLNRKIMQARLQVLNLQVNTVLLDIEAKKRRLGPQQLYDIEVTKRIVEPTDAEIRQFIEANREQLADTDPQNLRSQAAAILHGASEEKLSDEFVRRLRAANPVVPGVDINSANLSPSAVVVTIGGRPLTVGSFTERLKPIIYDLQLNTYQLARAALDRTIDDVLLIAEANKRNVPPEEMVRTEITEKLHHPTEDEIVKFYTDNKARIPNDLPAVRNTIASYLQQQEQGRLEQALSDRLRKSAQIRVLLAEPPQPAQTINIEGEPARGDANARVTLVEFTDFECPACGAMQPVLEDVLKSYGDRVRFVVRNYPLPKHPHARKAAEAAAAAQAQGKFFEYTSLLFKRQNALDIPSLKKYASELGLDRARFDAELDGDKYAAEVKHDIDDGVVYGVAGTPTIFINGLMLRELTADALRAAIDRGLAGSPATPK